MSETAGSPSLFILAKWSNFLAILLQSMFLLLLFFPLFALAFTIYYMLKHRKKVQTYIGISLKYVWISMFVSLVLINLFQFNVAHKINFTLQHPIFMVVIAFATVTTGEKLRYNLVTIGGTIFGLIALLASYFTLPYQLLFETIAWLIAFIIPGHYLFAKRKS